jgi:hypothetical protein
MSSARVSLLTNTYCAVLYTQGEYYSFRRTIRNKKSKMSGANPGKTSWPELVGVLATLAATARTSPWRCSRRARAPDYNPECVRVFIHNNAVVIKTPAGHRMMTVRAVHKQLLIISVPDASSSRAYYYDTIYLGYATMCVRLVLSSLKNTHVCVLVACTPYIHPNK